MAKDVLIKFVLVSMNLTFNIITKAILCLSQKIVLFTPYYSTFIIYTNRKTKQNVPTSKLCQITWHFFVLTCRTYRVFCVGITKCIRIKYQTQLMKFKRLVNCLQFEFGRNRSQTGECMFNFLFELSLSKAWESAYFMHFGNFCSRFFVQFSCINIVFVQWVHHSIIISCCVNVFCDLEFAEVLPKFCLNFNRKVWKSTLSNSVCENISWSFSFRYQPKCL